MCGRWGKERIAQRSPLQVGLHLRENRKGRTGPTRRPCCTSAPRASRFQQGEIWAVHTGWSGNHVHYAEQLSTGEQVIGGGELLLPGEVVLAAGETLHLARGCTGPTVPAWTRSPVGSTASCGPGPTIPSTTRPVTINVWEAVYFDHDLDRLVDLAERAAALGVERYVLDDGWFGSRRDDHSGLGDWTVSPDVWPNGLHPLVDKVTELGMQFGLWFEPEMINIDSDVGARPSRVGDGHRRPAAGRVPLPAGDQPRHARLLRLHPRRDLRDPAPSTTSPTSSGTTTATSSTPAPSRPADPACTSRRWPSTGCWTRSRPPSRDWRSSRAPPVARGSTSACWSGPSGSGCPTASTRRSGRRCIAGRPS